jgi:hypothetical protein
MDKVNLNSDKYSEKLNITKDNILNIIDAYSIFTYYIGKEFVIGRTMRNPFRENDTSPSLGIFKVSTNTLLYKDLGTGNSGDCFVFVAVEVFRNALSYKQALEQVIKDFNLEAHFKPIEALRVRYKNQPPVVYKKFEEKPNLPLRIKSREYTTKDLSYWGSYGIGLATLKKYNVFPIEYYSFGTYIFKAEDLAYVFIEKKDGETTYKIYQPFCKQPQGKFFTSMNNSIHAGYTQLPQKGQYLIITKSLKDVMCIDSVTGLPTVAVMAESIMIKPKVIQEYRKRFNFLVTLFDNDATGINLGNKYLEAYNIFNIHIPQKYLVKDYSDLVQKEGIKKSKEILNQLLLNAIFSEVGISNENLPF